MFQDERRKEQGFQLLMDQFQQRLYSLIFRMLRTHDDTNDVLQETFVKAWIHLDKFEGNSSIHTWLHRIAVNETLRFIDKRKRRRVGEQNVRENNAAATSENAVSPAGDEIQQLLKSAVEQLPAKQRLVFYFRYYEAMDYQSMSDILDTSVGALKASYHHAVKKIESHVLSENRKS